MLCPFEPVPQFLQCHYHLEKLPSPHIVVPLRGSEAVGEEGAGMQLKVPCRTLVQTSTHSNVRSIGLHHELTGRVRMNQDRSRGEVMFKVPERLVSSRGPCERNLGRGEGIQGGGQGAVTPGKAAIEVGEPQEALQLHHGRRQGPFHHRFHLLGIHLDTLSRDDVAQKGNAGAMELALFHLNEQLVLQKALENLPDIEHMFLGGAAEDEDVINVDEDEPVQHVAENVIHQSLEHGRGVGEAKGHDQIFVVAAGRVEGGLPPVLSYPHQVVGVR
ncbi:uncharacterized protein [Salvelinus sp. IW2-2015]|uniref:uncharacterized protein n=1 Tax=Salvelinus sp. IW2-2015 TaxID=2691554 RepID=UPI0038D516D1